MSGDIVDAIDRALTDYGTSRDAMRWTPDVPAPWKPGPADRAFHARYVWTPTRTQVLREQAARVGWDIDGILGRAVAQIGPLCAALEDALASIGVAANEAREIVVELGAAHQPREDGEPVDPREHALHLRQSRNVGPNGRTPAGRKRRT